jgi:phage terminase large subunit GpA-like protein
MYSPHESCTLGSLAVLFLESKNAAGKLRAFLNDKLAVPHQQHGFTVTENEIRAVVNSSPEYVRGEIPREDVAFLALTVDYNKGVFHWVTRAWFSDNASALVDYGAVVSWQALIDLSWQQYKTKEGKAYSPLFRLIDSVWRAKGEQGVYSFCKEMSKDRFVPTKGFPTRASLRGKALDESDIDYKGHNIKLICFDEHLLKHELYFDKIKKRDSKWWLPRNTGKDYEDQLTDEYLKEENGVTKWHSRERNEHLADAEKQQLIIPYYVESYKVDGRPLGKEAFKVLAAIQANMQKASGKLAQ